MKKIGSRFLTFIMTSCSIGKRKVYYSEMSEKPSIETHDNSIVVTVGYSQVNSALVIYKIQHSFDEESKQINLKGYQALGKEPKTRFELKINGISKTELDEFEYYWVDSSKTKTLI